MLPTLNDLFLPLLRICKDGKEYHEIKLAEIISDQLKLTEEERNRVISSGTKTIVNRIQWAVFELKCANLVARVNRIVKITSDGLKILQNNPTKIDLKSIPVYQEYYEQVEKRKQDTKQDTEEQTPDDIIRIGHDNLKQVIKTELLESIKNNTPNFFEHLVQDLLKKWDMELKAK